MRSKDSAWQNHENRLMLGDGDISFFFFSFFFKWMYLHMFENQLQVLTHLTHVCTQVCTSPMGTLTVDVMGFSSGEWVVILLEIHLSKCNLDKNLQLFCRPKVHYSGVKWSLVSAQTGFLSNRDVEWEHKLFRELKGAASSSLHSSSEEAFASGIHLWYRVGCIWGSVSYRLLI